MSDSRNSRNFVYSRQYVADGLRRLGFPELAGQALQELPDPVDEDQIQAWVLQHGITKDDIISNMGGSP
jgi:hypothetical protein